MSEFRVKARDVLIMPDGERWQVIHDDTRNLFWLSSAPPPAEKEPKRS